MCLFLFQDWNIFVRNCLMVCHEKYNFLFSSDSSSSSESSLSSYSSSPPECYLLSDSSTSPVLSLSSDFFITRLFLGKGVLWHQTLPYRQNFYIAWLLFKGVLIRGGSFWVDIFDFSLIISGVATLLLEPAQLVNVDPSSLFWYASLIYGTGI